MRFFLLFLSGSVLLGCSSENDIISRRVDEVAVVHGDFDDVAKPLNRNLVRHDAFDGIISNATWDDNYVPLAIGVEELFSDLDTMRNYNAIFVASGTRGLGDTVYNGIEVDDYVAGNEHALDNARSYVKRGNTVLATDWAYDLIERAWPDQIDFLGDDEQLDAAQRGMAQAKADNRVLARVTDDRLAVMLEADEIRLRYDFSNWAPIESVADDVTVWLRGDVSYQAEDGEGTFELIDAPLLVSFESADEFAGTVVYSTFHLDAQNDHVVDQILRATVGEFKEEVTVESIED